MDVKKYNYIMLTIGLTIFSVVSIVATFGYKYYKKTDKSFLFIFFISLFFGILSYFIKIPLLYYYGDEHDTITTYILSIVILTFLLVLHSKFILNEKVKIHTYIIIVLMIFLVLLDKHLSGF